MDALGVIREYSDLRSVIAQRRRQLGLSQLVTDDISGCQSGYQAKIECGLKNLGDMSFGSILGALDMVLVAMPAAGSHAEVLAQTETCIEKRKKLRRALAAKGGRARMAKMTAQQRRAFGRHAAKSRWRNWRLSQAERKRKAKRSNLVTGGINQ